MRHLQEDPEQPCGEVVHLGMHREFQEDIGNLNHGHVMVLTKDKVDDRDVTTRETIVQEALVRITAMFWGHLDMLGTKQRRDMLEFI